MTDNPKEVARRLREMAEQLDPTDQRQNVKKSPPLENLPIIAALQGLKLVDQLTAMGMDDPTSTLNVRL